MALENRERRAVEVFADWKDLPAPQKMGLLSSNVTRGSEIYAFSYDEKWLESPPTNPLDPDLQYFSGDHHVPSTRKQFGIFLDSSPDRWGRMLLRRREAQQALEEKRSERKLTDFDFLIGVEDKTRAGALRFKHTDGDVFLSNSKDSKVPLWTSLRELEQACWKIEQNGVDRNDLRETLRIILAPGSSLGGSRPKASVQDLKGNLWIAKFPSGSDTFDSGAWEMVVHELARLCDIRVSKAKLETFGSTHRTFLTQRFDRVEDSQERIHFASAMTLLQRNDGDDAFVGANYLELADFIKSNGAQPEADLQELWRRILLNALVSNCDDHLRNHGFLLESTGWRLSPAFDMNPNPDGDGLKLNISENDNAQNIELISSVAPHFRLQKKAAQQTIKMMKSAVLKWEKMAEKMQISRSECQKMARAFRLAKE